MIIKLNPILLPNVALGPKLQDKGVPKDNAHIVYEADVLRELLWELASRNPLWDFIISKGSINLLDTPLDDGTAHRLYIREVTVKDGQEVLGSFSTGYHGNGSKLFIANDRIANGRSGRNGGRLVTGDVKRAYREIIKNFYARNPRELTVASVQLLSQKLGEVERKLSHTIHTFQQDLENAATAFIKRNPQVLTTFPFPDVDRDKAVSALDSWRDAMANKDKMELLGIASNRMWSSLADPSKHVAPDNAAVVISQGSTYVLTYKGQTCTIPSEDLPDELRAPLGMLKLSDALQVVDGVGFRVDDRIFFVFAQENNDATTV